MRILKIRNGRRFRKTMATGLAPLLLLASLPGCVARQLPNWSRVQAVSPETKTEVQLYEGVAPHEDRKVKGRFLSATEDSVRLKLKDGQTRVFQREEVRKVLTRRPFMGRWPGWAALGITLAAMAVFPMDSGDPRMISYPHAHAWFTLPITFAFFWGSRMGGIYEVPTQGRDWFPQETVSPESEAGMPDRKSGDPPKSLHDQNRP